ERVVEARIDRENFSVNRGSHTTSVKPFPISVAPTFVDDPPKTSREELLAELGISAEFVGVGVERLDYTKGIPERFLAIGRRFERLREYRARLVFVRVAAPRRDERGGRGVHLGAPRRGRAPEPEPVRGRPLPAPRCPARQPV